jgi:putative transposase
MRQLLPRRYVRPVARPLRICLPSGVYHVISRGNAREPIYLDDDDRVGFVRTLAHVVARFGWLCHAYCLMGNHYHLLVETPQPNLPAGMRQLNGLYAQNFNRRYHRCGHLFQARYRSVLVEKETHLLAACRYVVLNPVRAGICGTPADHPWSSYRPTVGTATPADFLCTDWILSQFAETRRLAQVRYRRFVAAGLSEALEEQTRGERLGTDSFMRERFGYDPPLAEIPRAQSEPIPPSLAEIFTGAATSPVAAAYRRHGYTLREIAAYLGCHYSTVSRRLRREEAAASLQDLTPN